MAGSIYGKLFTVTTWGESHGKGLGVVIDGCPAGIALSEEDIQIYLDRRKPGQNEFTTKRNESDKVSILSGVFEGKTTGTPISLVVMNEDQKITVRLQKAIVRGMRTTALMRSMDSATTGAAVVLPAGRQSAELPQARSLPRS